MKRRLFNVLAAVSLAMCVASAALWVRSYESYDIVVVRLSEGSAQIRSVLGGVLLSYDPADRQWGQQQQQLWTCLPKMVWSQRQRFEEQCKWRAVGFGIDEPGGFLRSDLGYVLVVPDWFVTAGFAVLPSWWCWRRWRISSRKAHGACPVCGYDLRATPDRCPECGTAVAVTAKPEAG